MQWRRRLGQRSGKAWRRLLSERGEGTSKKRQYQQAEKGEGSAGREGGEGVQLGPGGVQELVPALRERTRGVVWARKECTRRGIGTDRGGGLGTRAQRARQGEGEMYAGRR